MLILVCENLLNPFISLNSFFLWVLWFLCMWNAVVCNGDNLTSFLSSHWNPFSLSYLIALTWSASTARVRVIKVDIFVLLQILEEVSAFRYFNGVFLLVSFNVGPSILVLVVVHSPHCSPCSGLSLDVGFYWLFIIFAKPEHEKYLQRLQHIISFTT